MNPDWKDMLSSLRGSLDEPNEPVEETPKEEGPTQKNPLTVVTDRKGRNGKTATIVEGFTLPQQQVEELARRLKQKLGAGGSVREGEVLIQGDRKKEVVEFLKNEGYKVK